MNSGGGFVRLLSGGCRQIFTNFSHPRNSSTCAKMASQTSWKFIVSKAAANGKKLLSLELYSIAGDAIDLDQVVKINPAHCNFTWHDKGDYSKIDELAGVALARRLDKIGQQMVMHVGCRNMKKDDARRVVQTIKEIGVKNILALKGAGVLEPDDTKCELPYALDFVKFLRQEFGDYFNIGVSGYPIGHPASPDPVKDIPYLKEKVDAGADFVLCQAVFDVETFKIFYKRCRDIGIDVPIIPGVYALGSNSVLAGVKGFCKVIPEEYTNFFQEHEKDEDAIAKFSVSWTQNLIEGLLNCKDIQIPGVHIFCFNNFPLVQKIVDRLDFDKLSLLKPQKKNNI